MIVQRVERHIFVNSPKFEELTHLSKNLYNYANYLIRQEFINNGKMLSEYEMTGRLAKEKQIDYTSMPSAQSAQQVIKLLFKNWKSFFQATKAYKKNPKSFLGRPKLPKYKDKDGYNILIFTNQVIRLKEGYIHFPKKANIKPIKTKVTSKIKQVRIVPQSTCFVVEVVYEKEVVQCETIKDTYLALDLGLNNFVTSINNIGEKPFIVNGKIPKSINQYFNKKRAKLMSYIGDRGTSNKLKQLLHKRNNKIDDYIHKTSRFIVDYCVVHKIENVVIGDNVNWKQSINIGKRNNQNFVSIPHQKLINHLSYKLEEVGINFITTEESYTSKTDNLVFEPLKKHGCSKVARPTLGKRVRRGLFRSSNGRYFNADVNGALGILRKVVSDQLIESSLGDRGFVLNPIRINPNKDFGRRV